MNSFVKIWVKSESLISVGEPRSEFWDSGIFISGRPDSNIDEKTHFSAKNIGKKRFGYICAPIKTFTARRLDAWLSSATSIVVNAAPLAQLRHGKQLWVRYQTTWAEMYISEYANMFLGKSPTLARAICLCSLCGLGQQERQSERIQWEKCRTVKSEHLAFFIFQKRKIS